MRGILAFISFSFSIKRHCFHRNKDQVEFSVIPLQAEKNITALAPDSDRLNPARQHTDDNSPNVRTHVQARKLDRRSQSCVHPLDLPKEGSSLGSSCAQSTHSWPLTCTRLHSDSCVRRCSGVLRWVRVKWKINRPSVRHCLSNFRTDATLWRFGDFIVSI